MKSGNLTRFFQEQVLIFGEEFLLSGIRMLDDADISARRVK
jgi:hypothetical protein